MLILAEMQRGKKIAALVQAFDDQPDFSRLDTAPWYAVNMDRVDLDLKLLYYPSSCDAETYNFLNESSRLSSSFCLQVRDSLKWLLIVIVSMFRCFMGCVQSF